LMIFKYALFGFFFMLVASICNSKNLCGVRFFQSAPEYQTMTNFRRPETVCHSVTCVTPSLSPNDSIHWPANSTPLAIFWTGNKFLALYQAIDPANTPSFGLHAILSMMSS
jgi:hypothetical protein